MIKCGVVAIIGKPNAGKSTLINAIIGEKVSIVSPKAQTTRNNILGILNEKDYQIVFIDTPGVNSVSTKLDSFMQDSIKGAIADVDAIVICIDGSLDITKKEMDFIERQSKLNIPIVVALTKIDLLKNEQILKKLSTFEGKDYISDIVPLSSKKEMNIDELVKVLLKFMPESEDDERYFEEDLYTDRPLRFFIAEIIREKALYLLDQEIPHGIAVAIKRYEETETLAEIDAEIICEKQSHKQIIIGKGGEMLKRIGHLARVSFQKVAQKKIYLNLFVRVKENWKNSPSYLNEIGYDGSEI